MEILFSASFTSLSRGDEAGAQSALSAYALAADDLDVPGRSRGRGAPLCMLAKAGDSESLGGLVDGGSILRYVEGALRVMRSHIDALSSEAYLCLAGTEGYESAFSGAQRAMSRLESYKKSL